MSAVFGSDRVAYPGLRAFGREEFDLFFGRESCVDEMVDTLGRTCFLAVLGTSGSGKSSLVRTGLLNALELGFLATAGSTWRIAELRPRGHPIRSLAIALLEVQGVARPEEAEIEILSAFLRRGPRSLIEWASSGHLPPRANLIVLVDQFEELFRYQDYSGREEAEAFVGLLVTAARENVPIHVAITMRSEYLGACTLIDGLPEVINRGLYLTPRMSREECQQAIVGPAEVCGFGIEERLVNKLLNDLTDFAPWEAGGGHDQQRRLGRRADQLPLMQHVLNLLWQRARARNETEIVLKLADYEAAGGLGGALDRHADEIAASVPAEHQSAIDPVFRSLVTGRTVEDAVRRPTRFGEIVALDAGERDSVAAVVDAFRAQGVNFLTPGTPDPIHDDSIIDISHESLIRQWRRLSRCLDEEAHSADAWNQLLTRAERHSAGSGGLLTGLDLDNLVDWWERATPIPAWANRYGNNFEEAEQYLRDSQFAEADRKRRDEEEERKLLAAEEQANTGRRFKRLAGALAAALIIAFGAVGASIYLWRESNAEALAAIEAQAEAEAARAEADQQRALAEAARTEAEAQRVIAEAEASAAEAARSEADRQRAIAEAERADAERARALAEAAEQAAIVARQQADQIIDSSIAYFAKSLGDEVAAIHADAARAGELGYAGGLLSRLAADARANLGSDVDTGFIDALRPAFVVQDALSAGEVPSIEAAATGALTRWVDPPGGPGMRAAIDWAARTVRLTDSTGRAAARYDLPTSFWGAEAETPFGAVAVPGGPPIAVMVDSAGQLWLASGGQGAFVPVLAGDVAAGRVESLAFDPASGKVFVGFGLGKTGERGQSLLGSGLRVAGLVPDGDAWRVADTFRMPRGPLARGTAPLRLAGVAGTSVLTVADGAVVRSDIDDGRSAALDIAGLVVDAGLTADGRYLLAGGLRDESGACFGGGGQSGFLDPWFAPDPTAPQPAGLSVVGPEGGETPVPLATAPSPECLLLYDLTTGMPLWRGEADDTRFHTVRLARDGVVEVLEGTAPDVGVLRLTATGDAWSEARAPFDPDAWGLGGFGGTYAAMVATGSAPPATLTPEAARVLMREGVLRRLALVPDDGRVIASRVTDGEVQLARAVDGDGGEVRIDVLVYRPGQDGFIRDDRIDGSRVACVPAETAGACRFDAAALSPDGNWLLVASQGSHAFVGRNGILSGWQANAEGGPDDGMAVSRTFSMIEPLDPAGNAFVASSLEDGVLRRITRLAATPQPQGGPEDRFVRQSRGPEQKAGEGASVSEGAGGTGGSGSGAASASVVSVVRLPGHVESDRSGFTTDPARALIYVWGPRIGLQLVRGSEGETLPAEVEFPAPIADVAVLGDGDLAAATIDGQLMVVAADGFGAAAAGGFGPLPPATLVSTGLGRIGRIDIAAARDRIIVNAGSMLADGVEVPSGAEPAPEAVVDVANLRALGYRVGEDGALVPTFVVPWEHFAGAMGSGEVVSVEAGGGIMAAPDQLPEDGRLLALAVMREEPPAREAPAFEIGFDMLHMRFAGEEDGAGPAPANCGWMLDIAVRMTGDIEENIGEGVKRACDEPAATGPLVNAIFDDRIDERIGTLLRLAPHSALARAVLASTLRAVAPGAAEALTGPGANPMEDNWEAGLAAIAESGVVPDGWAARVTDAGFDPFAHWMAAIGGDHAAAPPADLAESLYNYAYAERLFEAAGVRAPPQVVKRRLALARILGDDVVLDVFGRLETVSLDPAAAGVVEEPLDQASLAEVRAWLDAAAGGDETAVQRLQPLVGLVEEMAGDEAAETDAAAAGEHYRAALAIVLATDEPLSGHAGIVGRIEAAEELGVKLAALGDLRARPDTAAAVIGMIDATLAAPVRRDLDPPELRAAIAGAFSDLAAAGAEGYDFSAFRSLGLRFLDFDWESRFQSINQVGAERFYRELMAAESFASAAVDAANDADRQYWLTIRGRLRFWLSTLEFEGLPYEAAVYRDWLAGALADYDAAGGAPAVSLWDATIIGGAHSRMVELAATDAEALDYAARSAAAFRNAVSRDGTQEGYVTPAGTPDDFLDVEQYRRRLAYDGYMLALERAMIRLRADRFLSGVDAQPGDPGYDRAVLADIGYAALDLAEQREALRAEAEVNGLIERNSTWSLDTVGDFYWGATVGQLGGLLRREAGMNGSGDLCERLAAHPYDVTRAAPAVDYDSLDVDAVVRACKESTPRSLYHQARALSKAGTAGADEILRLLLPAAREGLPIAYNSISALISDANGPVDDSQLLMTTFSQLSLIESYPQIAALLRENKKSAARAETFEWLARKAAGLGVPEAYVDIAELTPDVLTQALDYTIARDLFSAAGRTAEADAMQAKLDAFNLSSGNVATLAAQAAARTRVDPVLLDDAMVTRIEDLLWDARGQATLR